VAGAATTGSNTGRSPKPTPGPGEVLLCVLAAGVNNTDINTRLGWCYSAVLDGTGDTTSDADRPEGGWNGATGVGPWRRTGSSFAIDPQAGLQKDEAHGQAPHPQRRVKRQVVQEYLGPQPSLTRPTPSQSIPWPDNPLSR